VILTTLLTMFFGFLRGQSNDQAVVVPGELSTEEKQEVQEILYLEKQQEEAIDFRQNSAYMKLNPYQRNRVTIQYLINSEQGESQAIYEAVKGYIDNGGLARQIAMVEDLPMQDITDTVRENSPMLSLLDNANTTITITIGYYDEVICERLADQVEAVMDRYADNKPVMGYSFALEKIQRSNDTITDIGLLNNQRIVIAEIDGREVKIDRLKANLNEAQLHLLEVGENPKTSSSSMDILKYLLLGLFAGCFIGVLLIDIKYILNANIKSKEEMKRVYGVKVFGVLYEEKRRKFTTIDRCVRKLAGEDAKQLPIEQSIDVIATELLLMCKTKKISEIYLAISVARGKGKAHLDELQSRLQKDSVKLVMGDNIINNIGAMKKANEIGNIVLVEEIGVSRYKDISSKMQLCSEIDIIVCGTILMNIE